MSYRVAYSLFIAASAGIAFEALPTPAAAEIERLTVLSARDIGPFAGKPYREVEARLHGKAPGGAYEAPVTLAFPTRAGDFSGFAVVDIVNTITLFMEGFKPAGGAFPVARVHMGDDFLFERGAGYVAVNWDDRAVERLGDGGIAARTDGYAVLADAAALARDPGRHLPAEAGVEAPGQARVIAYGYSQSGSLLRDWLLKGRNSQDGAPVFDGALVVSAGAWCRDLETEDGGPCEGPAAGGAKTIALLPQADVEWGGVAERGEDPNYRTIDIAGVSHIPAAAADFRELGMPEQNPVGFGPAVRGALANIEDWLDGREPPPSLMLEVSDKPGAMLMDEPLTGLVLDADGNAAGGLRLPHMPTELANGAKAGAPLGTYGGLALDRQGENIYFTLAGTFTPFPPERLAELYPDHAAYVAAVRAAAEDLAARRYILPEDAAAYVAAAEASGIGRP